MELGEKLRQARLEAGLSQRNLCGDRITRNMLSQIEHGAARPSMDTLRYFSARLGKSVSYFLDEDVVVSPNGEVMAAARRLYDAGDWAGAVKALEDYRGPDEIYDREQALMLAVCRLNWAEQLQKEGRRPYGDEILENTETAGVYCSGDLERRRLLLLGQVPDLPSLDEELLLRAEHAEDPIRAASLLEAAEDRESPRWNFLRGRLHLKAGDYAKAAALLSKAEEAYPDKTIPLLEQCCRELGDYKRAYEYACKQKK